MVEPLAHALFRSLREAGFFLHEIHHVVRLKTQFIQSVKLRGNIMVWEKLFLGL